MYFLVRSSSENQNGSELLHYGVKGMKWGVRKEYEPSNRLKKPDQLQNKKPQILRRTLITIELEKTQRFINNQMERWL